MELIKASELTAEMLNTKFTGVPILICSDAPRLDRKLAEAGYKEISLNKGLSKALLDFQPQERLRHIEDVLLKLAAWKEPVLLCDFEMLFDPRYKIDVLKFICDRARTTNIAAKWPGKYKDGKLFYASPEEPEYKEYSCDLYQLRIVK